MEKKWIGYLALILFLFLPSPNLFSDIGMKSGLSLSFAGEEGILFSPAQLYGPKTGFFYAFQIGDFFSIQTEINYVRKGNKFYCNFCEGVRIANLEYLEIPIMINIHFVNKTVDLFSGVYVGILLDSIKNFEMPDWTGRDIVIRKADYGILFGARYRFLKKVIVELQFSTGLIEAIYETNQAAFKGHKNNTLSLLLGFGF